MRAGGGPGPGGFLESVLRQATGDAALRVRDVESIGGGCIHSAVQVRTSHGSWFAKWNERCAPDLFLSEAEGLRALRRAAPPGIAIPEVLCALSPGDDRPACIVMEYLPPGTKRDDEALGRGLAAIHAREPPSFGFPVTTYCGPTPQDNRESQSWVEFYGVRRLAPLLRRLEEQDRIGPDERRIFDRLIERLPALLSHAPRPALIHGDLWSGNALGTSRGPALVDPACAACDREMEFGITTLFGGFSEAFFSAYEEAQPLPRGWRERNPLYQIYHLLNHHLIFGGHYGREALSLARRHA